MALVFNDTFTDTNGVNLDVHTPDTGTGWTEEEKTGVSALECWGNNCEAESSEVSHRATYSAQPDPTVADYDVEFDFKTVGTSSEEPYHLFARLADLSNFYLATFYGSGATDDYKLNKKVAASFTELASLNETISDGDTLKLEIKDANKKVFNGVTEKLTSTDNALTSAGKAGISHGNWLVSTDDMDPVPEADNFKVTEQAVVGGITVTPSTLALVLSEFAPTVSTPRLVTPPTLALVLSEFAPTVTATANQLVTPPTLALTLASLVPTADATDNLLGSPPCRPLLLP